ncbi:transcriptional regulator ATRX homolog [Prorops nasuta]|uniref:transcriptional regulator ATRX homolog n=1 Tax=Prorops nasuta TaxID=863751 RepID=UPI0034CE0C3F
MTRFARAKGSKASNERVANDPTPWYVMKQQLTENTQNTNSKEKPKTVKELIQEKDEHYYHNSLGNIKYDWAEFEDTSNTNPEKSSKRVENKVKSKSKRIQADEINLNKRQPALSLKEKKKQQLPKERTIKDKQPLDENNDQRNNSEHKQKKLSKRQKRNLKNQINNSSKINKNENVLKSNSEDLFSKVQKSYTNSNKITFKSMKQLNHDPDNQLNRGPSNDWNKGNNYNKPRTHVQTIRKRKAPKIRDNEQHKRRKPCAPPQKLTINGVEVEIVQYDGFPVRKEDAERLTDLKQQMIMRSIPKSEIDAAMKLERRKAEKALTRIKKCVCFHCRKSGHNLSDCPELDSHQAATGICFKCGSTEHTHFECKVSKAGEFRYATCFICREQGHIAKQCPDNPKGVYPQGGACKVCGDVTHLKKDCPDLQKEKEETAITLSTITDNQLESLEEDKSNRNKFTKNNSNKKIVKF